MKTRSRLGTCPECGVPFTLGSQGGLVHPSPCQNWLLGHRPAPVLTSRFSWRDWDVTSLLPAGWQRQVLAVAADPAAVVHQVITPTSVTSREDDKALQLDTYVVPGNVLARQLPWADTLYRGPLKQLAQEISTEELGVAQDIRYGAVLNVQPEGPRYELHVDSQPVQGLLYFTSHPAGCGGALRIAGQGDVRGLAAVEEAPIVIYPQAGHFLAFDGRGHTHYVDQLIRRVRAPRPPSGYPQLRVVMACNYYTRSSPESSRPADLSDHLGLTSS